MGYGPLAPEATEIRDATLSSIDAYHPAMLGANAPGPDNPFVTQDDLGTLYYIAAHLSGGDAAYVSRQMVTGDYG